ncbi:tripartite tricarboxylate transporter TctB family protein [Citricoccus sp.]|uniref:tripartite tricarboxylate transporter TctB family protein n=1 Tax=Citricoccus sp. TaxID=1978372 RepID=UPI002633D844|nr:tripartite tricarboxylate transporter TctB family protein [Citricoccus sp.]HRO30667.1 tripartite tricarboxylate transporter TctB family protein [Citricoccus sp.]HRO94232.1 tripartite tricarboxylate transporter TctB family protein [Citricoccus sp.]
MPLPAREHLDGPVETTDPLDPVEAQTPEELVAQWEAEAPPQAGPVANLAASLVVLALGIGGIVLAVGLGIGTASSPGPGTWPLAVSVLVTVLALAQAVIGRHGGQGGEKFTRYSWITLIGFLTLVAMVVLIPLIGFEIPALLLCLVWMRFLGGEGWRSTIVYSLLIVAAFYAIFIAALGTSIPHLI